MKFPPTVVPNLEPALATAYKVVGVSEDHELLARCETEMRPRSAAGASASRSQPYYLDITHPLANKGAAVLEDGGADGRPDERDRGDRRRHNDLAMFAQSGFAIAMGNAPAR